MELLQAHSELDDTLPEALRVTANLLGQKSSTDIAETSTVTPSEDTSMTGTPTATSVAPMTSEAITAAAHAEVERVLAHRDSANQMAATVERVMLQAQKAEANLAESQTKLTAAEQKLATVEAELAEAKKKSPTNEPTTSKDADKDAKDNKGKPPKGEAAVVVPDQATASLQSRVEELTLALAAEKKKTGKLDWMEKSKARKAKADKAGIKSKKFMDKAEASTDDGTPVMSDEEFDSTLEILTENAGTTPVTAADTGGTPVAAPVDAAGPSSKESAKSLTGKGTDGGAPIPAPTVTGGPASSQTAPKMAHASETPAVPDLSTAEMMQQATAAFMSGGPVATATGKSKYAQVFGCKG